MANGLLAGHFRIFAAKGWGNARPRLPPCTSSGASAHAAAARIVPGRRCRAAGFRRRAGAIEFQRYGFQLHVRWFPGGDGADFGAALHFGCGRSSGLGRRRDRIQSGAESFRSGGRSLGRRHGGESAQWRGQLHDGALRHEQSLGQMDDECRDAYTRRADATSVVDDDGQSDRRHGRLAESQLEPDHQLEHSRRVGIAGDV